MVYPLGGSCDVPISNVLGVLQKLVFGFRISIVFDYKPVDERFLLETHVKHVEIFNINLIGIFFFFFVFNKTTKCLFKEEKIDHNSLERGVNGLTRVKHKYIV